MARFVIRGRKRVGGVYTPAGNKNAALPMLAAALLTEEPVTLHNVPLINDVVVMLEILQTLGVVVDLQGHTVRLSAAGARSTRLRPDLCEAMRSSVLFAGPLAARLGRATLYPPGGDVIGRRRLDAHFQGLRALGIDIAGDRPFVFRRRKLRGAEILLDEASVTATENVLMAAALAEGKTVISNAACEPHVQDLCALLGKMGARIDGAGTNRIIVHGRPRLRGASHTVQADHVEVGSFAVAALVTGGDLSIRGVQAEHLPVIARAFAKLGVDFSLHAGRLHFPGRQRLQVQNDFGDAVPKIEDGVWPGFPSDLMSVAIVLATQAKGTILFFEKMFESRMYFVDRLIDMGARIVQCDPHRVLVVGPSRLQGTRLASPDIRAGMAMILAALCAEGVSVIENAQVIDRGYERIDHRLRRLGADIVREE